MTLVEQAWGWLEARPEVVLAVGVGSVLLLIVGALGLPMILVRLPADHFVREHEPPKRIVVTVARNLVGGVVLLAGIAMLALPGQGLLTILAGLLLVDFPGKRRLTLAIVRREGVRQLIDRIRARSGQPPLELPE